MYQGETITTEVRNLPLPVAEIESLCIIFHTITKTILEKTLEDCRIENEIITCKISQAESLKFPCGPISRTVIVLAKDGARFEKTNQEMVCGQTARKEVMV